MPTNVIRSFQTILIVVAVAAGLAEDSAWAARNLVSFPPAGMPPVDGLRVTASTESTVQHGYLPIKVDFQCVPAPGDRTVSIVITSGANGFQRESTTTADLDIPAGTTTVSILISVPPSFLNWNPLKFDVWEDGASIDGLSFYLGGSNFRNVDVPALLVVHESASSIDATSFYEGLGVNQSTVGQPLTNLITTSDVAGLPPDWINYTEFDLIGLSIDELQFLIRQNPQVWQAIRVWTSAGGNLCVYDMGDQLERTGELDKLISDQSPLNSSSTIEEKWSDPDPELYGLSVDGNASNQAVQTYPGSQRFRAVTPSPPRVKNPNAVAPKTVPFRVRPFRLGKLVAMASNDPFPLPTPNSNPNQRMLLWQWVTNTLGDERVQWNQRHGLGLHENNSDFWNFLIPGIGLPPVNTYRVLITLFVVLIGPVNYFVLRRFQRLHLLLFIVPICAAIVTAMLLGYAVIADGLGVRLRARSYTLIDQPRKEAVSWNRLSYYAGLSPDKGLDFSQTRQSGRSITMEKPVRRLDDEMLSGTLVND